MAIKEGGPGLHFRLPILLPILKTWVIPFQDFGHLEPERRLGKRVGKFGLRIRIGSHFHLGAWGKVGTQGNYLGGIGTNWLFPNILILIGQDFFHQRGS